MKKFSFVILITSLMIANAQVGINTTAPEATLDVNGDLIIRTVEVATPAADYDYLVANRTTKMVEKVAGNIAVAPRNTSIAKVSRTSTTSLLGTSLYSGYRRLNFAASDVKIDFGPINSKNFNVANGTYTVPSSGVYAIEFHYQYGNGVELQLLSFNGNPNIAILKQNGASYTVVDSKIFSGANVSLLGIGALSVVISQAGINSVYEFAAGDVLTFEVFLGGIAAAVLGKANTSISIHKISN